MYEDNGEFSLNVDAQLTGIDVVNLADNDDQQIISGASAADAVSLGGTMIAGSQPITFTETGANTNVFVNFDESNNANMFVTSDALRGTSGTIEYNDTQLTILAVEPKDAVRFLKNDIQKLIVDDSLDEKKGKQLTKKLDNLLKQLDEGEVIRACNLLNSFINEVNKLVGRGELAETDGDGLSNLAERIKTSIGCQ